MKIETLADKIYQGIKDASDNTPRSHLGASIIGHSCDRYLWYSFRWIAREDFDGRMLRLFRRGQDEESPLVGDLRRAGLKISDIDQKTKRQFSFKNGFFAGSMDGIIHSGVPESPLKEHILEIKTHSKKSFEALEKAGVEKSKPMHFAQMQTYMGAMSIDRALYVSVCKDDDRIYAERVRFDKAIYEAIKERAQRIIASDRMPEPMSTDPTWFECKFCSASDVCFGKKIAQEVHCRTCSNVTFLPTGKAHCQHWDAEIPTDAQINGCDQHVIHPDILQIPMEFKDGHVQWKVGDVWVKNGEAARDVFTSAEILADAKGCASMIGDDFAQDARMELGARLV